MDVRWALGPDVVLRFKFKFEMEERRLMAVRAGARLSDFPDVSDTLRLMDVGRVAPDGRRVGRDMVDTG